jgi:hypothetical protein
MIVCQWKEKEKKLAYWIVERMKLEEQRTIGWEQHEHPRLPRNINRIVNRSMSLLTPACKQGSTHLGVLV